MTLLALVMLVVGLGIVWYLVTNHLPLAEPAKNVVHVIFVVILILLVMHLFGLGDIRIGNLR